MARSLLCDQVSQGDLYGVLFVKSGMIDEEGKYKYRFNIIRKEENFIIRGAT